MKYDPYKHRRRSIRLKEYDYSQASAYFVTICTQGRECLFGNIVDGEMRLNEYGRMGWDVWHKIPEHFSYSDIDEFVFMPNHAHGIIVIQPDTCRGEVSSPILEVSSPSHITPISIINQGGETNQSGETPPLRRCTLGKIVAYFKYQTAKRINIARNTPGYPVWQRNYYEHVIRNDQSLQEIREYIINNPLKWESDQNNPANVIRKDAPKQNRAGEPRPYDVQ